MLQDLGHFGESCRRSAFSVVGKLASWQVTHDALYKVLLLGSGRVDGASDQVAS